MGPASGVVLRPLLDFCVPCIEGFHLGCVAEPVCLCDHTASTDDSIWEITVEVAEWLFSLASSRAWSDVKQLE